MAIVIEVVLALVQRALTPAPLRRAEALAMPDELMVADAGGRMTRRVALSELTNETNRRKHEVQ